jgi:ubiquinol-cytochrome c reductase cytochrome b subunit
LPLATAAVAALAYLTVKGRLAKALSVGIAAVLIASYFVLDAKVWGVILMGASLVVLFFMPYLDRSPVKSIRYRGWMFKLPLAVFVVAFVILGYLGTKPPEGIKVLLGQVCTLVYFAFFALMPWYTALDKTKPVPERVTK